MDHNHRGQRRRWQSHGELFGPRKSKFRTPFVRGYDSGEILHGDAGREGLHLRPVTGERVAWSFGGKWFYLRNGEQRLRLGRGKHESVDHDHIRHEWFWKWNCDLQRDGQHQRFTDWKSCSRWRALPC